MPTTIVMLPIAMLLLYWMLKPDLKGQFELNHETVSWDKGKVVTLTIFALTVSLWIFSKPVNELLGGFKSFDTIVALGAI
ncbi:hypothetical protein, partial [Bacillus cereus group sp. BC309]|uniref:hypothetical protein n=1 Tax=Bacillus cereus group sp. BC309 TaxID=3445318 RepID=UPI003F6997A3